LKSFQTETGFYCRE